MSIKVLEDARAHPARDMAMRSMSCVETGDREGWLGLWAEDGVIQDPVGVSPLDPEGLGHRGIEAITAFYDKVIGPAELRFHIRQSFACGSECANVGTITTRVGGAISRTELVAVYCLNPQGKLASLRAFWEFEDTIGGVF
ncbi:MAG: nuclear transport factor 2 family protein [Myxococcota bacterium]|nr:nuclear transport factor 2 family protein [Myxococcota bacterium]